MGSPDQRGLTAAFSGHLGFLPFISSILTKAGVGQERQGIKKNSQG
jgi:hypothetical protein